MTCRTFAQIGHGRRNHNRGEETSHGANGMQDGGFRETGRCGGQGKGGKERVLVKNAVGMGQGSKKDVDTGERSVTV